MPEQTLNIQIIPPGVKRWNGKTVLNAHNCALLERFTGKSYSYWVVNMKTGVSAHICHKRTPLPELDREGLILRFLNPPVVAVSSSGSNFCVDMKRDDRYGNLPEVLTHIFETLLPEHGYSLRSEQLELARDIFEALCSRSVSLAEAGVGIGKTHAYLIAAAMIKRGRSNDFWMRSKYPDISCIAEMPVVVATSSIALQKAIIKDYIPEISKILKKHRVIEKSLTSVIRKGKEHYICERRIHLLWHQTKRDGIKPLLEPFLDCKSGFDLDDIDTIDAYTKRRINVMGPCGKDCTLTCRYRAFIGDAQTDKYDFQICNHNYLLADIMRRANGQKPLIPHYQSIIIDEAHKFLAAARSMYGTELSKLTMPRIAMTIRRFIFQQGQSTAKLWRYTDMLIGQSKQLFRVLVRNIPDIYDDDDTERFKTVIDDAAEGCMHDVNETLNCLIEQLEDKQDHVLLKYKNSYSHTLWELKNLRTQITAFQKHDDLIYWLECPDGLCPPNQDGSAETLLCSIPKKLGEMLHTDIWNKGVPIILTSGTLSAAGDFTHIKQSCGLDRLNPRLIKETSRPSPFNYQENALIYISESVPYPDSQDMRYITAVADEMEHLITAAHGHTVALFTSYRVMDFVFDILQKRGLPFPLFMMGRGRINAIEQFKQSGNGVLFATGSMWEGVDLPGDILSLLVIVKLPFAVPDPISEHEQAMFGSIEKYKNAVIVPEMLVKLLQGFGRLIRSLTDTGVVAILDSRVREGGAYRERILRALPKCRVTKFIADVAQFILKKKTKKYFKEGCHRHDT